jgi:hypothetical protein
MGYIAPIMVLNKVKVSLSLINHTVIKAYGKVHCYPLRYELHTPAALAKGKECPASIG